MKADWEELMAEYKDSATVLIGDVDCTADGESLCRELGGESFPSLKFGVAGKVTFNNIAVAKLTLQTYEGGRSLADLKSFVADNLAPQCGPEYLDLCNDAKKSEIAKFSAMSASELDAFVEAGETKIEELKATLKAFERTLQEQIKAAPTQDKKDEILPRLKEEYAKENAKKDRRVAKVNGHLDLAKAVKAFVASKTEL